MSPTTRWAILCLVGLLLAGVGGVAMLLGGYIGYGESMSKPSEGLPFIVGGGGGALAGISLVVFAIFQTVKARSARRRRGPAGPE
jgi:hypothetical protein